MQNIYNNTYTPTQYTPLLKHNSRPRPAPWPVKSLSGNIEIHVMSPPETGSSHSLYYRQAPPTPSTTNRLLPLPLLQTGSSHSLYYRQAPPTPSTTDRLLPLPLLQTGSSHSLYYRQAPPTPSITDRLLSLPLLQTGSSPLPSTHTKVYSREPYPRSFGPVLSCLLRISAQPQSVH